MKNKLLHFLPVLLACFFAHSQVSVTGPACALPGVEYQYLISTTDTIGTGINISLTGGTFAVSASTSLNDSLVASIRVIWNTGITSASISFSSPAGSATNNVNITSLLLPGSIDTAYLQQSIGYDSAISSIPCPAATGGACSPSYAYQWQQSSDGLGWTDIAGAAAQNLSAGTALTQSSYFRRKVTETGSGSIAYSNTVYVYVSPAPVGSDSTGTSLYKGRIFQPNTAIAKITFKQGFEMDTVYCDIKRDCYKPAFSKPANTDKL